MNATGKPDDAATSKSPTLQAKQYPQRMGPVPEQGSNVFIKEADTATITINTPFTVIPGLPALNKILARIDKTTKQDLGFTFKLSITEQTNPEGRKDWLVKPDYVGGGIMSSKFNVQMSPFSFKVESGKFNREPHWGCSASVLSAPIGFVHERLGVKGRFSDCNSNRSFSAAPEASYQKGTSFKPLSTATAGLYLGNLFEVHIPAEFVQSLKELKKSAPSTEEWKMIADHIAPSIPAIQIGKLIDQDIEMIGNIANAATSAAESAIKSAAKLEVGGVNLLTHTISATPAPQHKATDAKPEAGSAHKDKAAPEISLKKEPLTQGIEPSNEEKASYTVQKNDTLSDIGKKTGCSWNEILALNKATLKDNADKIYPGQELLIPDTHAALINHPVVKAQILANMVKHEKNQSEIRSVTMSNSETINGTANNLQQANEIG